jgi:hypothetical protein
VSLRPLLSAHPVNDNTAGFRRIVARTDFTPVFTPPGAALA